MVIEFSFKNSNYPSLNTSEPTLDGIASFGTKAPSLCNKPPTKSLIVLREVHLERLSSNLVKPEPARFLTRAIEQSNTLIDLIGFNMGSANTLGSLSCPHLASGEFNWHFQTPVTVNSLLDDVSDEVGGIGEYGGGNDVCVKRRVHFESDCAAIRLSRNICGDGIVDGDEACDCDRNDSKCGNCCDMDTCQFRSSQVQCAVSDCYRVITFVKMSFFFILKSSRWFL